ncbi:MAG: Fe-S cluster assembly protein IscX [bacterium]
MTWNDIEDIAEALYAGKPDVDPLTVRFTDLRNWIAKLPEWKDDIHASNEAKLEAVQMEWYELWKDGNEG